MGSRPGGRLDTTLVRVQPPATPQYCSSRGRQVAVARLRQSAPRLLWWPSEATSWGPDSCRWANPRATPAAADVVHGPLRNPSAGAAAAPIFEKELSTSQKLARTKTWPSSETPSCRQGCTVGGGMMHRGKNLGQVELKCGWPRHSAARASGRTPSRRRRGGSRARATVTARRRRRGCRRRPCRQSPTSPDVLRAVTHWGRAY